MEFRLTYQGILKSNGSLDHKHELRKYFHAQLKALWGETPLRDNNLLIHPQATDSLSLLETRASFVFAPLVCQKLHSTAQLHITLLRPESPGAIVTQAGDLDNRLKTLFDALRMPQVAEIPKGTLPAVGENPFFCLLQDDNLISQVTVVSDRLLTEAQNASQVILLIHVVTQITIRDSMNASLP